MKDKGNVSKENIKIDHINAQSLQGNFEEIKMLISERNPDILCISETWLLPFVKDCFVHIPHFNLFRRDHGKGGGVCIYVRDNLKSSQIDINTPKIENVEDLWLSIQSSKFPSFIIGTVYRHPYAPVASFDYISDVFKEIILCNKSVFIVGDMNDDLFYENSHLGTLFKTCRLHQLIGKAKRITQNSSSLIDVIATNNLSIYLGRFPQFGG